MWNRDDSSSRGCYEWANRTCDYNPVRLIAQRAFRMHLLIVDSILPRMLLLAWFSRTTLYCSFCDKHFISSCFSFPTPQVWGPKSYHTTEFWSPSTGTAPATSDLLANDSGTKWHADILFISRILSTPVLSGLILSYGLCCHSLVNSFSEYWMPCIARALRTNEKTNKALALIYFPSSAGRWVKRKSK